MYQRCLKQPAVLLLLTCILLSVAPRLTVAQVNIEKTRVEDPEGLSFTLSSSFSFRTGNLKRYDLGLGTRLDYKIERNHIFILGNVGYGESRNQTYKNRSFAHIRFMHDAASWMTTELFSQVENDEFTLLRIRILAGVGVRIPYIREANFALYQGTSLMLEHESLDPDRVVDHPSTITANRWNNYINLRFKLKDNISFFNTGYFQPRFDDFGDYRILLDSSLQFAFTENFSFSTSLNLRYDSRPPDGLEPLDLDVRNGFRLTF